MLSELLERTRDRVADDLEHRAAVTESTEPPFAGRRKRLNAFVDDLIGALRRGAVDDERQPPPPAIADPALELRERDLVRRYLIEEIEDRHLAASPSETVIVAEWAAQTDRNRLREQNRRLSTLLDGVQECAVLFDPEGRILYCNRPAFQRLRDRIGVPRGEIIGRTPAELGVPGELVIGRPIDELLPLARGHESFEMTAWGRANEGTFDAVYQPDGKIGAIALVVRDVHNRKLAETRLNLLTKLNSLAAMMDYDEVAKALVEVPIPEFADWCAITRIENKRIRRTFLAHRDPSKAALRDAIMHVLPAWDRHPLWRGLLTTGFQLMTEVTDDLLRRLAANQRQYRLLSQVGVRSLMVVPLVSRGQISGIMTFLYTDESGRRYGRDDPAIAEEIALNAAQTFENARLMKNLKASESRFRIALAGARTVVYEQDTALRYVWYYNPLLPVNLLGKTHDQELPPDEAKLLTAAKRRVLEEGEGIQEEMDFTFGGEERRHFRHTIEPLRDPTGKIVGVIGAATDLTEKQRTQQRLTEELEFRERMMGILGHDLRNPLNTVMMAADLMLRRPELPPGAHDQMLRLRRAAGRMHEMIDTLLDFSRARFMGKVPVSRVPTDLGDVARAAIDEMRILWPEHAIQLQVRGDVRGAWDPARMSQTIANLVTNAISYGHDGKTVRVTIDGEAHDVVLKVHNHGPAIPADMAAKLFEPFRRGIPEDCSPGGLGLGLYIVKQIVLAHDGTIAVESTATDGTTFILRLPRGAPPAAGQSATAGL